jgi:hypothetical protein
MTVTGTGTYWYVNLPTASNTGDFVYIEQVTTNNASNYIVYASTQASNTLSVSGNAQVSFVWSNKWLYSVYSASSFSKLE